MCPTFGMWLRPTSGIPDGTTMRVASGFRGVLCAVLAGLAMARAGLAQTVMPPSISLPPASAVCAPGAQTLQACLTLPAGPSAVDIFYLFGFGVPVTSLLGDLAANLEPVLPGVEFGIGAGNLGGYGGAGDDYNLEFPASRPLILNQPIVTAAAAGGSASRDALVNGALGLASPSVGGSCIRSNSVEALYQIATGVGFDGDGDGSTTGIGGLQTAAADMTKTHPDDSGDIPAFATLAPGVITAGRVGGAGFRPDALKLIIVATDNGSVEVFSGLPPASITGPGGTVPVGDFEISTDDCGSPPIGPAGDAKRSADNTVPDAVAPLGAATLPAAVDALGAAGIRVLGLGPGAGPRPLGSGPVSDPSDPANPSVFLSAIARVTGAVDATGTPLVVDSDAGQRPLRDAVVQAVEPPPVGVALTVAGAIPAGLSVAVAPSLVSGVAPGGQACFDVTFASATVPPAGNFALEFRDSAGGALLGTIPVSVDCGVCRAAQECDDGNPCTDETCTGGRCARTNNTAPCDDGDVCNGGDACRDGICTPVGAQGSSCAASVLGAFLPNYRDGTIAALDVVRDRLLVSPSPQVGPRGAPWGVAVTPDGRTVYVSNRVKRGSLSVVDTADPTHVEVASIEVGKRPVGIAVHPDGSRVYVANLDSRTVSVVDATTRAVKTIKVGKGPAGIAVNSQGTRLYVTNYRGDSLSVIDVADRRDRVVKTIAVPAGPIGVAVDPSGTRVYVASYLAARVTVVGTASNMVIDTIRVGSHPAGVAVDSSGSHLFVTHAQANRTSVIDAGQDREIARVRVGRFPFGLEVAPDGKVFVANTRDGSISVVDPTKDPEHPEVHPLETPLGGLPVSLGTFLAVDPRTCPAPALQCDDGDRDTLDSCVAVLGCRHATQDSALDASRTNVDALASTYRQGQSDLTVGSTAQANRVGTLIGDAQRALHAAPADVASAKRTLRELIGLLEGGVAGMQPRLTSRLLDLSRAAALQLRAS